MKNDLFSDLGDLGFESIEEIDLFNKDKKEEAPSQTKEVFDEEKEKSMIYEREVICPVCGAKFKAKTVKKEGYRVLKRDSDSFIHYATINPYFYDVWICNNCGYAASTLDFQKIKSFQIDLVKENITRKWQGKNYPEVYDINIAIERYKMALLNYFYMDVPASRKAMLCLKLAWMHRIQSEHDKEISFIKQALEGFQTAYSSEDFPICNMDRFTYLYLLGELNRRIGDFDKSLSWFSQVITTPGASQKIKDKCRDQKDLIEEARTAMKKAAEIAPIEEDNEASNKKEGFFSKFFKK